MRCFSKVDMTTGNDGRSRRVWSAPSSVVAGRGDRGGRVCTARLPGYARLPARSQVHLARPQLGARWWTTLPTVNLRVRSGSEDEIQPSQTCLSGVIGLLAAYRLDSQGLHGNS